VWLAFGALSPLRRATRSPSAERAQEVESDPARLGRADAVRGDRDPERPRGWLGRRSPPRMPPTPLTPVVPHQQLDTLAENESRLRRPGRAVVSKSSHRPLSPRAPTILCRSPIGSGREGSRIFRPKTVMASGPAGSGLMPGCGPVARTGSSEGRPARRVPSARAPPGLAVQLGRGGRRLVCDEAALPRESLSGRSAVCRTWRGSPAEEPVGAGQLSDLGAGSLSRESRSGGAGATAAPGGSRGRPRHGC
jgi:hypothetical protein